VAEPAELREAKKRIRLVARERGSAEGICVLRAGQPAGKIVVPLVRELAADGIPSR
jgi:hypothetical protein